MSVSARIHRTVVVVPVCTCDHALRVMDVFDLRCPEHGLTATLEAAVRAQKEHDRG